MIKLSAWQNMHYTVLLLVAIGMGPLCAKSTLDEESGEPVQEVQVRVGNFALPSSQQPSPLISFGQNIVDRGDLLAYAYLDYFKGHMQYFTSIVPSVLYGITDRASVFVVLPIAAQFIQNDSRSSGLGDLEVQFEHVLYDYNSLRSAAQITLVANVGLPTGSASKMPAVGFGSTTFFLGGTASYTTVDWYPFVSSGVLLTTSHAGTKFGNQFLYQCGLGKNIASVTDAWLFNCMIELDGTYRQKDRMCGKVDQNSGGNYLLLGPSLWFSTQHTSVHAGISWVISQHLFGVQNNERYYAAFGLGWKF